MTTSISDSWQSLLTVSDTISAQALAERLNAEGVPTKIEMDSSLLGEARGCEILVPGELLQRARWLLSSGQFSDEELTYLATGELSSDRARAPKP
jgi:hypothetical protein